MIALLLLGAVVAPACTFQAMAAETTGAIVGRILSGDERPIAGVRVDAASPSGRAQAVSDPTGRFTLVGLSPDTYIVAASASGYSSTSLRGVTVLPGGRVTVELHLARELHEIAHVVARGGTGIGFGETQAVVRVGGDTARGPAAAGGAGLGTYMQGSVQAAIAAVPGIQQDQYGNAVLRAGKVDDIAFSYDAVPVPQALIAEPGGNVIGAQLVTTGVGFTTVTTDGAATGSDNALAGLVDQIPSTGVYPARTRTTLGVGLVPAARDFEFENRWATPSLRRRYAFDARIGSEAIGYGDGHTFYPAEAATYGLSIASRATWSIAANAHLTVDRHHDDLELLTLAGEATYDQYDTPFAGETYGSFDGNLPDGTPALFPGEPSPTTQVTTPSRIRGTYTIEKLQLLRTYAHAYARLRVYRSLYGAVTRAPFFDDLSFPNGVVSYAATQYGNLDGIGLDIKNFASERHQTAYGIELRRQTSGIDQVVPTLGERLTAHPTLSSYLSYLSDEWSPTARIKLDGALRLSGTHVERSDGKRYDLAAVDPHLALVYRVGSAAARLTFDHETVAPKPLQVERNNSALPNAPFIPLAPERGDTIALSLEHSARSQLRLTLFHERESNRIDVIPADYRSAAGAGQNAATGIGVPQNVGDLDADGLEFSFARGPLALSATYVRAVSSSASQFGLNDLNAPAIAAGHLFPVGYVPNLSAILSYRFVHGPWTIEPVVSYQTGYPYGNGKLAWVFDPNGKPIQVPNDNHVNPGYSYYFLRDPSRAYDPQANPYIGSLGTPEGGDPNTLRSPPATLVSLRVERALSPHATVELDVDNLFAHAAPTQLTGNPYLIGPPGY
ncbi:MAG: carboxypeptidase regulatory-like domain-containing protein, partial [Vulcanimicrobiaceae bacterium]